MELNLEWTLFGMGYRATVCGIEMIAWPETETRLAKWMVGGPHKEGCCKTLREAQEAAEASVYAWLKEGVELMGGKVVDG